MITKISVAAGEILTLLDFNKSRLGIKELAFILDEPKDLILMAVGWLAREGFVHLEFKEDEHYISLYPPNPYSGMSEIAPELNETGIA